MHPKANGETINAVRFAWECKMIQTENLIKTYKIGDSEINALDDVSIEINKGEMVAIIGPSGSGKSTLMNILGCLDTPDSGQYMLAGEDVFKLSTNRLAEIRNKHIGFVFQSFNLLPRISSLENVELPLLYCGKKHVKDDAKKALEIVGLENRMYHEPNQLSGGQRQRVSIARALVTNPDIILADEPTGNLDSKTGEEILRLFDNLNKQGQTIIIVTHDRSVADRCQRAIVMKDGKAVSQ